MPDVTEATAEVGQMILQAIQNTFHMGPADAVASAQASTGVSAEAVSHADMGHVFDYMCGQPGLSPEVQQYLTNASTSYHNSVHQSGSSYSGGSGYSGYSGSNAQIVQQITQNYSSEEINDNHIDILGPVDGDIDIDQDNDQIGDVHGDGNAINTGEGDQNAVTGDHSSGAQAGEDGSAQSNSGDGAVQVQGSDVEDSAIGNGAVAGEDNTVGDGNATGEDATATTLHGDGNAVGEDATAVNGNGNATGEDNAAAGDHGTVVDNAGGTMTDNSLGFGQGNVQGDVNNEAGAANSQGGDAHGHGVDLDFGGTENHGQGTQSTDGEHGDLVRGPVLSDGDNDDTHLQVPTHAEPEHVAMEHEAAPEHEATPEHLAAHVDQPAEDDHSALVGGDEHHAM